MVTINELKSKSINTLIDENLRFSIDDRYESSEEVEYVSDRIALLLCKSEGE